jgi:hypothetical protein
MLEVATTCVRAGKEFFTTPQVGVLRIFRIRVRVKTQVHHARGIRQNGSLRVRGTMAKKKIDPLHKNKKQYGAVSARLTVSDIAAGVSFYQRARWYKAADWE